MARSIDITEAYTLAEQTVYRELLTATSCKDGKNAFLGHMPSKMTNLFALKTGGGGNQDLLDTNCFGNLVFNFEITARFNEREKATHFIGLVLKHLNNQEFEQKENLQCLVLDGMPEIEDVFVIVGRDDKESLHFEVNFSGTVFASAVETLN